MQTSFKLTPKQAEYIRNANHRWNVACGAVRSGKSYCQISYCIPSRLVDRKGLRGLRVILGATRANIERNVLQPMRDLFGDGVATSINSQNVSRIMGEKVYCIGADNVRQVAKIKVFEMLKSRLSLPWSTCDATTNPSSPNHWFKEFLDSAERGVDVYCQNFTIYDNPFLPEDYVRALEAEYAGSVWYDRYILGEWTLAGGLVYPDFKDALVTVVPPGPADEYVVSLDYGTSNPFAAILWELKDGVWYATKELYYSGRDSGAQKTDGEYLIMLTSFADNAIECMHDGERVPVIVDPSAASFIALLRKSEYFRPVSANNEVLNGIREVNSAIKRGLIKVYSGCKNWVKEAQSYVWDMSSQEDKPIKDNDHLMDSMRYFVKTKRIAKPIDSTPYQFKLLGGKDVHLSGLH